MARRKTAALVVDRSSERAEIIAWYREQLENTPPPSGLTWDPVKVGPSWQHGPDGWLLPEASMGWEQLAWSGMYLRNAKARKPWAYTMEQARFLLWFHALNPDGSRMYHSAVLQRLKGWGKDPLAAATSLAAGI